MKLTSAAEFFAAEDLAYIVSPLEIKSVPTEIVKVTNIMELSDRVIQ